MTKMILSIAVLLLTAACTTTPSEPRATITPNVQALRGACTIRPQVTTRIKQQRCTQPLVTRNAIHQPRVRNAPIAGIK